MANEIAAVYVSVIPETSKIAPGIKNAFKGVDGAAANAGKGLGAKLAGALGTTLKAGVAGAGVAAGAALGVSITKGLGRLSSLDQANAKLKGLGYTGGEITRVMESVSGSVKGTAFGLDEAAGSAAKLGAVGVETGQQMDRAMKLTADIAAQAGTGMDDVSSIMAKIAGAGKVTGETLAQLDDRATGAGAAIAEHLGVSIEEMREQVSAGTVDFETFQKAMEDHLGGAAQATGETVKGSFDNMGAAMGRFGEKLMSPAFIAAPSIFSAVGTAFDGINEAIGPASERIGQILAPAMESVATVIETRLTPMLADGAGKLGDLAVALTEKAVDPALWERIGDIFGSIRDAAEQLWPSLSSIGQSLLTVTQQISVATWEALGAVINAIAPILETVLVPVLEDVAQLAEDNPGLVKTMVVGFLGFKAVSAVVGPIKAVATTIRNVGGALKFASAAFKGGGLAKSLVNIMGGAKSANPIIASAAKSVGSFTKVLAGVGKYLGPVLKVLGTVVRFINPWVAGFTLAAGALTWFFTKTDTGQGMMASFLDSMKDLGEWVSTTFTDLWAGVVTAWQESLAWFEGIGAWFGEKFEVARQAVATAGEAIKAVFEWIAQAAVNTIGVIGTIVLAPFLIAWNLLSAAVQAAWTGVIKPVWDALATTMQSLWTTYILPAVTAIQNGWQAMTTRIQAAWTVLKDAMALVWQAIKTAIFDAWAAATDRIKAVWETVTSALSTAWNWVRDQLTAGFNAIKAAVFNPFMAVIDRIKAVWDAVTKALSAAWGWVRDQLTAGFNAIKAAVFDPFMSVVGHVQTVFQRVMDALAAIWDGLKNALHAGWVWIDTNVFGAFQRGLEALRSFVGTIVDGIGTAWNKLRALLAAPINFLITSVYNNGIAEAWDTIAGFLPLEPKTAKRLNAIPAHATGGRIIGPGTGTSDDVLMWGSNGEHMLTKRDVDKVGGHGVIYQMRRWIQSRTPFTVDGRGGMTALPKKIDNTVGDLAGIAPQLLPKFRDGGEIRPLWELQLERGHAFARAQHGKPYQWAGPTGQGSSFDCSGFMGSIAAAIQGTNPWQRYWATGSFPVPGAQGFAPGLGPGFSIGVWNGGPYGGHTSGTLGPVGPYAATNVESGGSPSMVKYGPGAAGADHSQHTMQFHLPIGADGGFVSGGAGGISPEAMREAISNRVTKTIDKLLDPIVSKLPTPPPAWQGIPRGVYEHGRDGLAEKTADVIAGLGDRLGTVYSAMTEIGDLTRNVVGSVTDFARRGLGIFDTGGVLESGALALNRSGRPELVLNNSQWRIFSRAVNALPGVSDSLRVVASELDAAFVGSDSGFAVMSRSLGETIAKATVNAVGAAGGASGGRFGNIGAFAEQATAKQWTELAGRVGLGVVGEYINPIIDADETLKQAYAAQAQAADDVIQSEQALAQARADLAQVDPANTEAVTAAQEKVTEAEHGLAQARNVVAKVAAAAGHAEIGMILAVADAIFKLINKIIGAVNHGRTQVAAAMATAMDSVAKWTQMVDEQRQTVSKLQQQLVSDRITQMKAAWDVRTAQADVVKAQLEGVRSVAEAEAKLEAERAKVARSAMYDFKDLSLAYDRYRWMQKLGLHQQIDGWLVATPEILALQREVQVAQLGAQIGVKQASVVALDAVWAQHQAAINLAKTQQTLAQQSAQLALMQQTNFGMGQAEALTGATTAQMRAEVARLKGERDSKWWSIRYQFMGGKQADEARIAQLEKQIAEREATGKGGVIDADVLKQAQWLFSIGLDEQAQNLIKSSSLGDAERAIAEAQENQRLLDIAQMEQTLAESIERTQQSLDYETLAQQMRVEIAALQAGAQSHQYSADALREQDPAVRAALEALAQFQADNAADMAAMATGEKTVFNLTIPDQVAYSREQMTAVLEAFGKVDDIELRLTIVEAKAKPLAHDVMSQMRG